MKVPVIRRISLFALGVCLVFLVLAFVYAHLTGTLRDFPIPFFVLGVAAVGACGALLLRRAFRNGDYLTRLHERLFLIVSTVCCFGLSLTLLLGLLPLVRLGFWGTVLFGYVPLGISVLYLVAAAIRFRETRDFPEGYPDLTGIQMARRLREGRAEWGLAIVALAVASVCLYRVMPEDLPLAETGERADTTEAVRMPDHLRDNWESLEFLTRAADSGNAEAQYRLGTVYSDEEHPRFWKDPQKAVRYFEMASDQDHPEATRRLAYLFRDGFGVFQDDERAAGLFARAAERGDPVAQKELGRLYLEGKGVDRDAGRARELLRQAAEAGEPEAANELAELYQRGRGGEADPERAYHWFSIAARAGNAAAQNDLGLIYLRGAGVDRDIEEGLRWLREAAEQELLVAAANLGIIYYRGDYVPSDYEQSYRYLSLVADSGHVLGNFYLGSLYLEGRGVERNAERAFRQFKKAADRGYVPAIMNVGGLYLDGNGVARDLEQGMAYIEQAAVSGLSEAQWRMGLIYHEGEFVVRDPVEAQKWFLLASVQGHEEAGEMADTLDLELSASDRRTARSLAARVSDDP